MTSVPRTPASATLEITSQCNLRCKYCSHFSSAGDVGRDLPTEEWLRFLEELGRCAVMRLTLTGGEPFLRQDLPQLIDGVVRNRMRFSIQSNASLVTDELAAMLAASRRCDSVQVSIDGSMPSTHEAFRGKGTFAQALRGIQLLQKHAVFVGVRVTIHRRNVADLEDVARLLLEDLGLSSFSTNSASHMGLCRKNADMVQLTTRDRMLAMQTLIRLTKKYQGRITATAGPLAEAKMWMEMEQARRQARRQLPRGGHLTGCGGVLREIAVRADGVMVPCPQLSHIALGRINQERLVDVWQNHPELRRLRERSCIPLGEFEFCRECAYASYCTGNCPALAYTRFGEPNHPSPDACLRRFLEEGGALPEAWD